MDMNALFMIGLIVLMVLMMWWSSRKNKQRQAQVKDFRETLAPGTLVVTIGGVIGKVVSVDNKFEEIVIDSEGSQLRFKSSAISKEYVRPAYIDDDEVDENGNPLNPEDTDASATSGDVAVQESHQEGSVDAPASEDADKFGDLDAVRGDDSADDTEESAQSRDAASTDAESTDAQRSTDEDSQDSTK